MEQREKAIVFSVVDKAGERDSKTGEQEKRS